MRRISALIVISVVLTLLPVALADATAVEEVREWEVRQGPPAGLSAPPEGRLGTCNLLPYAPTGWAQRIVPRDTNDTRQDYCPWSSSLPGNVAGTYMNLAWINEGPDSCGYNETHLFVDGEDIAYGYYPAMGPGGWIFGPNWGPFTIRGGRHVVSDTVDYYDQVVETDESDNSWMWAFSWTPMILTDQVPVYRSAPPRRGPYLYPACDGFQFTGTWWSGVAMLPVSPTDDYGLILHDPYDGTFTSFDVSLDYSGDAAGNSDFLLINANHPGVGYGATRDVGVVRDGIGAGSGFYIEQSNTSLLIVAPGTSPDDTLEVNEIMELHTIQFTSAGLYTVELEVESGNADLGLSLYDYAGDYMDKLDYMTDGFAEDNGSGEGEIIHVGIPTPGFYAAVIWKTDSYERTETAVFRLHVYLSLPNLIPYQPAGWDFPVVPRDTNDTQVAYAPLSAELPGNTVGTYINYAWKNDGAGTAGPHETHFFLDGEYLFHQPFGGLNPGYWFYGPNQGPIEIRGGRHTLGEYVDYTDTVVESQEGDNYWEHQFVWSPLELTRDIPESRPMPPQRGSGPYPNCDGYYFPKRNDYTYVTGLCPRSDYDYDLYLYDNYANSQSGFSNLLATSDMPSGETEFVGIRYDHYASYPAAVMGLGSGAGGLVREMVVHAMTSEGEVYFTTDLPVEIAHSISANRILRVYDVEMDAGVYDFHLVNETGNADLAVAIMPRAANFYGRGDAAVEANAGGQGDDEAFSFTSGGHFWYEVIVFKTGYQELNKYCTYRLRIGEEGTAGVAGDAARLVPDDFVIEQNRPNPFSGTTAIRFGVPAEGGHVRIKVFDASGRLVATLADAFREAGYHTATWDGTGESGVEVSSGVYFCRLEARGSKLTRRMLLLK
jgi:hypothetical protein